MILNFRNPFLWLVLVLVGFGILTRHLGFSSPDSPATSIGYLILGFALSIAYTGYNRGGWGGVLPAFERLFDIITGRWR